MDKTDRYKEAGVDIDEGNRFVELIKPAVKRTFRPEVATDIGGFGAMFRMDTSRYKKPLLVSSTDGVGTKLKISFMAKKYDTVGIDLVAMSVNDLVVQGAEPLFFLDYFATGKLESADAAEVVNGISDGCVQAGCALIGGETAEMAGFYDPGEFDLAGFAVGVVDEDKVIDGKSIAPGDVIIGLESSGIHSNGYSLVRKIIFEQMGLKVEDKLPGMDKNVGEELLTPTRIYVKAALAMAATGGVKGFVHITGGGFYENIPRILPEGLLARIQKDSFKVPPIFNVLQENGNVSEAEMYRVFNMGIGFVAIVDPEKAEEIIKTADETGEKALIIGKIEKTAEASHVIME